MNVIYLNNMLRQLWENLVMSGFELAFDASLIAIYLIPFHMLYKKNRSLLVCIFFLLISFMYADLELCLIEYPILMMLYHYRMRMFGFVWFYLTAPSAEIVGAQPGLGSGLKRLGLTWIRRFCLIFLSFRLMAVVLVSLAYYLGSHSL